MTILKLSPPSASRDRVATITMVGLQMLWRRRVVRVEMTPADHVERPDLTDALQGLLFQTRVLCGRGVQRGIRHQVVR